MGWGAIGFPPRRQIGLPAIVAVEAVAVSEVPEGFERWLAGRPLAERSRRQYGRNVRAYCAWLAVTADRATCQSDPLVDPLARDHAARDLRRYLQVEHRAAASTVNLALASLDAIWGWGGPTCAARCPELVSAQAMTARPGPLAGASLVAIEQLDQLPLDQRQLSAHRR